MKALILVVSSDEDTIQSVSQTLHTDYELIVARSGEEATRLYVHHFLTVQMVILDTALNDTLAHEWLKKTQSYCLPAYTLLLASDSVPGWMIESMKSGAMDIVMKNPLYESELLLAVQQGFDYRNLMLYIARSNEHAKNQRIHNRMTAFLKLLHARKSKGLSVSPNEIALYFPSQELEPELPLEKILEAIESDDTYALMKQWKDRPTLLIIEDEDSIRNNLHAEFGRECEVILASSCEDALGQLSDQNTVDIAILDIGLPGMSGDDFVPVLKEKFPKIQIVMLTGYREHRLIVKTLNSGVGDYVVKPFSAQVLRHRVFGLLQSSVLNRVLANYMMERG